MPARMGGRRSARSRPAPLARQSAAAGLDMTIARDYIAVAEIQAVVFAP